MGKIKTHCAKCGKEFELDDKWRAFAEKFPERVTCVECKNGAKKDVTTAYKNAKAKTATTGEKVGVNAQTFRKAYDELVAEFSDIIPEVKDYLGGWASTIVINNSRK